MSLRLAERMESVVALDLECPPISHPRVLPISGDVANLEFTDRYFDVVLCAEVLEHLSPNRLPRACAELARVARGVVVIGVPYREDLRCGRTTCQHCGAKNPPWGHVNSFDEPALRELFSTLEWTTVSYVGRKRERTNALSTALLDFAGNPFGTYDQSETCVYCGHTLGYRGRRTPLQRVAPQRSRPRRFVRAQRLFKRSRISPSRRTSAGGAGGGAGSAFSSAAILAFNALTPRTTMKTANARIRVLIATVINCP